VLNRSLGNIIRCLGGEHPKHRDNVLAKDEFSYNDSPNMSTCLIPFQISYGIHPRGIYELRDLGKQEMRSVDDEDFAVSMQELQERVNEKLQDNNNKYRHREDLKQRQLDFEVGDLVMEHLRKEMFLRGEYNRLKLKKIGPCKVLRKFSSNFYELKLPSDIEIYPIFNVSDLHPFKGVT
jgi:hypothetical protein